MTFCAGGSGPAGRALADEGVEAVAAGGAVAAGRAGAVVHVLVAQRAGPAALAGAREAARRGRERALAVHAGLRRARVVHALAVRAREALRAPAQVLVRRGVLTRAAVLARLVRAAVVQIWDTSCELTHFLATNVCITHNRYL